MRKKVGIIGAGIFGISCALQLGKDYDVTVFEQGNSLLCGASTNNHWRHHHGFHYPRSKETVREIQNGTKSFEREYKDCIIDGFPAYYFVAKENTLCDSRKYLDFCDEMNLSYTICDVPSSLVNSSVVDLCIRTNEGVYDMDKLHAILKERLSQQSNVSIKLNQKIIGGKKENNGMKTLSVVSNGSENTESFDFIINATYSFFNEFNEWFGFKKREFQYELFEHLEIKIPYDMFAITIMDGEFPAVLPRGKRGTFTFGHVNYGVLNRKIGSTISDDVNAHKAHILTNKNIMIQKSIPFFPFLKEAKIIKSHFVTRVVMPYREHDDARPTVITDYGDGMYSIFSGKIVSAVEAAEEIARRIRENSK